MAPEAAANAAATSPAAPAPMTATVFNPTNATLTRVNGEPQERDHSDLAKISSIIAAVIMGFSVIGMLRLFIVGGLVSAAAAWGFAMNLSPRQPRTKRLLALTAQILGDLGVLALFTVAMTLAEGGKRGYDVIPFWATLIMLAVLAVLGIATKDGLDAYREDSD